MTRTSAGATRSHIGRLGRMASTTVIHIEVIRLLMAALASI